MLYTAKLPIAEPQSRKAGEEAAEEMRGEEWTDKGYS